VGYEHEARKSKLNINTQFQTNIMSVQTSLNPYLMFNGNCKEAMNFYKECFDANLEISTYGDSPMEYLPEQKDHVLHSSISKGNIVIMASDSMKGQTSNFGSNISLSINCASREELDILFDKLAEGGKITMPKENTFWGAYFGMLTDKFGIHWMFNYDTPKE
jgi:PhnB protein